MSDLLIAEAENELRALRVQEALSLFDEAECAQADPDLCAAGRWQCHMLSGNFELAWRESDLISRRGKPDPNRFWDGRPLEGHRILVRCLHGLGDTIQFIRYVRLIRGVARSVVIEAQPKLKRLLAQSQLADTVITWSEPEPAWDRQIEIMELPLIFRTTLETIPRCVPYLHVEEPIEGQPQLGSTGLRVGIAWSASMFNPARSIPIEEIARIFSVPGISFFGLQSGAEHNELLPWSSQICDLHRCVSSIDDTARVLKQLHLVITVDTMTAHLAGALAVPVWTLLPYECDWRWMLQREDSPWYPTMRLFRQPAPGDWKSIIDRLISGLLSLSGDSRANGKPYR